MPITWRTKLAIFAVYAPTYCLFYLFPNFYSGFSPSLLPLWGIDLAMPFLPWTFVVYLSDYILALSAIVLINDRARFYSYARVSFLTLFFCGSFFLFFPTTYPRPVYPEVANPLVAFLMSLVGSYDTPNNCFPSMHVAITAGTVYCLRYLSRKLVITYSIWAIFIFISTLTTKQHYFVDILGGLAVAGLVAFLERRVLNPTHAPLPQTTSTH